MAILFLSRFSAALLFFCPFTVHGQCSPETNQFGPTKTSEVNVVHDGKMFSFKWNETSCGRCVDEKENTYSYGAYYNIPSYEECAKTCLNKMDQLLLEDQQDGSGSFRGIDYVCEKVHGSGSCNPNPDKYYFEGECRFLFVTWIHWTVKIPLLILISLPVTI